MFYKALSLCFKLFETSLNLHGTKKCLRQCFYTLPIKRKWARKMQKQCLGKKKEAM